MNYPNYSIIEVESDYTLPYQWIGSTIRGMFGVGLKRIVCINPSRNCSTCFANAGCLFYEFYETQFPFYRLEFQMGTRVNFRIYLFGEKITGVPYVISALYKGLKEIGIGKERIKLERFKIKVNGKKIFDGTFRSYTPGHLTFTPPTEVPKRILLRLETPLRIKEGGRYVREGLKLETLLRSIWHRWAKIEGLPLSKLPFRSNYQIEKSALTFIDFARYSNRQQTKMRLGGVMGEIELTNLDLESYRLLKLGEIIGVGKQVTFGLGKIGVKEI